MAARKKIALVFATGSLLSIRNNKSVFFVDSEDDVAKWLAEIPEVMLLAEVRPLFLQGESELFTIASVEKIAELIRAERAAYDGFVVLVRGENMIYAASAIEFMLQGLAKPIIFTGSRYSPEAVAQQDINKIIKMGGLGLRSNLINAIQVACTDDFTSAAIMYGNKIIQPARTTQNDFYAMNLFRSVDDAYLGKVDFGISVYRGKKEMKHERFTTTLSRNVFFADSAMASQLIESFSESDRSDRAILIRMNQNERFEHELLESLRSRFRDVILFNDHYVLNHPGTVELTGMTWEAARAKVQWAHAVSKNQKEFHDLLTENIVGEFISK